MISPMALAAAMRVTSARERSWDDYDGLGHGGFSVEVEVILGYPNSWTGGIP